ncbi:type II toxin-antitoxin system VapC family toxin [Persephonella sp.]
MRYLLDTHVFLWACVEPEKLPTKAIEIIQSPQNILFLSCASIWEISIKMSIQKLKILSKEINFKIFVEESIKDLGLIELKIESSHIFTLHELPYIHKDPYDRILIAQALSEDLILITNDDHIKKYNVKFVW